MKIGFNTCVMLLAAFAMTCTQANAQDGVAVSSGLTLRSLQDTPTGFGNSDGSGGQAANGSEIDGIWGDVVGGVLKVGISGNLEQNFNKFFVFFDAVAGGENELLADNVDGGSNEINALAGLTFDTGFTADHALRFEVGGGFYGIRTADLIDNTGSTLASGGGPGDLPLTAVGSGGVTAGWDNSNATGVTDTSAADAGLATTGWEFDIDLGTFFGGSTQDIKIAGFITSGDGSFLSNQVIGGLGASAGNLGSPAGVDFNGIAGNQFVTIPNAVPEPGSLALLGLGGLLLGARRRRR